MSLPPLLWAGNAVVGRLMVGQVPPLALNALRWSLALLILLPLGWRVLRAPGEIASRWPHLLLLGTLGVGSYNALQYMALVSSTPINVTLIAASMPVWMLAVGALFHGVHPSRAQLVGAVLSLAGVLLVIARGSPAALARVQFVIGDLYVLAAIIGWAFYSWMLARPPASMRGASAPQVTGDDGQPRGWNWAETLLVQVMFGLLGASAAAGAERALGDATIHWSPAVLLALVYVAIGPSVIAYRCWGLGVARAGPAAAAFFGNLTPLIAALLSAAVLGEAPRWYHALAFALIVGGIVVSSRAPPRTGH
ncbi:DMT family transporter [Rivibacter subsaxonicus]|nr:DMT family transporter [Rivibacter subsaxonicus]